MIRRGFTRIDYYLLNRVDWMYVSVRHLLLLVLVLALVWAGVFQDGYHMDYGSPRYSTLQVAWNKMN